LAGGYQNQVGEAQERLIFLATTSAWDHDAAKMLAVSYEARRIAANIAKLPELPQRPRY
jgi:hypothetical protein